MTNQNALMISRTDLEKISAIVSLAEKKQADLLEEELARAVIVADDQLPGNIVAMNSVVTFEDLDSHKVSTVTLVYPPDANFESGKISVLAPIGAALIGLSVGQSISWPISENKTRHIKIISVGKAVASGP